MDFLYTCVRLIVKPFISAIWIKEVDGLDRIPQKGSAVLAINHQSYFDFFCLAVISPRNVHFLAAEKFFDHWLWGLLMRITNQVRVDRLSKDKDEMHHLVHFHIDHGKLIGIFPEGTRSPFEYEMLKAFSGIARYAINKKVPIVPIGIRGTFEVMSRHDKRINFKKSVSIHVGIPMNFPEYYVKEVLTDMDYRTITHNVMKEIAVLSNKNYSHEI